jgi:hypothetical protein
VSCIERPRAQGARHAPTCSEQDKNGSRARDCPSSTAPRAIRVRLRDHAGQSALTGLVIVMLFQLVGELVVWSCELRFPGPLMGMGLLFLWLVRSGGPFSALQTVASSLIESMGLLFSPSSGTRTTTSTSAQPGRR